MIIGVPKEIKNNENRVAITPAGVHALLTAGHHVLVEKDAGAGSGFGDEEYRLEGAEIVERPVDVWSRAAMIMKVKEPEPAEYTYFRKDLILFTYLHLAANVRLTEELMRTGVIAIAYETIEVGRTLPLLTPMSEVAGRMAAQIGAHLLEKRHGGRGILLSGVPGVERGKASIIGGGIVGVNAAKILIGLGAQVTILDINVDRLRNIDDVFNRSVITLHSNSTNIRDALAESDLVIGAVLIPGAKAPKLVSEDMVRNMKPGAVIIDVAVDQGGIFETIDRVTTHDQPTYEKYGVVHYAVANMPGAVPRTSTLALTNATLPYAIQIAAKGIAETAKDPVLSKGINVAGGFITNRVLAEDLKLRFSPVEQVLMDSGSGR